MKRIALALPMFALFSLVLVARCTCDGAAGNPDAGPPVRVGCASDTDCPDGQSCRNNLCRVQGQVGQGCQSAEDCELPLVCVPSTGECTAQVGCTTNADCGNGAVCNSASGECVPSTPAQICEDDSQCIDAERCVG